MVETGLMIFGIFWIGIGLEMVREEMAQNNKKVLDIPFFWKGLKTIILSMFYGPFTRSKLISKL